MLLRGTFTQSITSKVNPFSDCLDESALTGIPSPMVSLQASPGFHGSTLEESRGGVPLNGEM